MVYSRNAVVHKSGIVNNINRIFRTTSRTQGYFFPHFFVIAFQNLAFVFFIGIVLF